ncbi:hypothetical protein MUJ63_06080 [Lachnospiraceae bacterium NSJ-143]|nr:hypothetical protein [Lachnospiraceae bacterium NSJ-143]
MGANRFMVLKFRDIIKTAVFALIGVLIILCAVYFIFSARASKEQVYNPGTYSSDIVLDNGRMTVEVKVSKTKIKSVKLTNCSEDVPVFYPLFESTAENVEKHLKKEQELSFVPDEDTPETSRVILQAVEKSLEQAKI